MTTRTVMLAEMANDLERTDTTNFMNKIAAAIRHYQRKRFWFNESRSVTFNTVASTDTYLFSTIGTEFYTIDKATITIASGDVRELTRENYDAIEEMADEDTTTGEPSIYAYINLGVRLWRSPNAVYSTLIEGHTKVAAPVTDGEAGNVWMVEAYDLIMSRAKAELFAHVYHEAENAMIAAEAERQALASLQGATMDKVQLGRLEPTEF